ncbi:hypothetical protein ACJX0J_011846, partial [Zea mays]
MKELALAYYNIHIDKIYRKIFQLFFKDLEHYIDIEVVEIWNYIIKNHKVAAREGTTKGSIIIPKLLNHQEQYQSLYLYEAPKFFILIQQILLVHHNKTAVNTVAITVVE